MTRKDGVGCGVGDRFATSGLRETSARLGRRVIEGSLAFAAVAALAGPPVATAQERGVQTTPGQDIVLVSKDRGDERWAISLDLRTGTAIGNVFARSGGTPSFVWCSANDVALAAAPNQTTYTLDCFGASACPNPPCDASAWTPLGEVELSGSFFFSP
jgi:hypothetical protein